MKSKKKLSLEIFKIARLNNAKYIIGGTGSGANNGGTGTTDNPTITCQTHEDACDDTVTQTARTAGNTQPPPCGTGSQFPPVVTGGNNPPPPTFN